MKTKALTPIDTHKKLHMSHYAKHLKCCNFLTLFGGRPRMMIIIIIIMMMLLMIMVIILITPLFRNKGQTRRQRFNLIKQHESVVCGHLLAPKLTLISQATSSVPRPAPTLALTLQPGPNARDLQLFIIIFN